MQISLLRRILGAGAADGCCIQTVAGRGYRFVAPIKRHGLVSDYSLLGSRPKFSLVVLPFANLNSDADHQYLVDVFTEDLTTDLSRVGDMVVISRNTAFTYQGKRIATRQIGRELGVRYVLEGSVRRIGDQVRINAQLIDAEPDSHLWAERFDRRVGDLFALQDEVVSRIAPALNLELAIAEAGRRVERPDAMDCIFRGRAALAQPLSLDTSNRAIEWFERALSLDSGSAEAQARLAWELASRVLDFLPTTSAAALDRAECLARQAVTTSPRSALTHFALAQVFRAERRYVEAIAEYETTLELDRNWVSALAAMG